MSENKNVVTTTTATTDTAVVTTPQTKRKIKPWIKWAAGGAAVAGVFVITLLCLAKGKKAPTEVVNAAAQVAQTTADAASTVA